MLVSYGVAVIISHGSAQPPNRQLAAILRRLIDDGTITARLPGERELADQYGVALGTVRKALAILRDEGRIETTAGWGSYVRERPAE